MDVASLQALAKERERAIINKAKEMRESLKVGASAVNGGVSIVKQIFNNSSSNRADAGSAAGKKISSSNPSSASTAGSGRVSAAGADREPTGPRDILSLRRDTGTASPVAKVPDNKGSTDPSGQAALAGGNALAPASASTFEDSAALTGPKAGVRSPSGAPTIAASLVVASLGNGARANRMGSRFFPDTDGASDGVSPPTESSEVDDMFGAGERRGERASNNSDAGAASNINFMESRLAEMLEDGDLDGDGGLLSSVASLTLGEDVKDEGEEDAEEAQRRKEQEEARKHAEWMKKMDKAARESKEKLQGLTGSSPTSSQAASDASTVVFTSTPGSVSPPGLGTSEGAKDTLEAPSSAPTSPPAGPPGLKSAGSTHKDGWSSFGGIGGTAFGSGATGGFGGAFRSAGPFGAFGGDSLCAESAAGGASPRGGIGIMNHDKEQLLRTEIGTLREALATKDAQCATLGAAAVRMEEAEARAASLVSELEATRRQMKVMQHQLERVVTSDAPKSSTISPQAWQQLLEENGRLKVAERSAAANNANENEAIRKELAEVKERADRMWKELEDRDRTVQSLQRQLAAIDRSPPPLQAPPPVHTLGGITQYASVSSLHVGAPAFKPQAHGVPPHSAPSFGSVPGPGIGADQSSFGAPPVPHAGMPPGRQPGPSQPVSAGAPQPGALPQAPAVPTGPGGVPGAAGSGSVTTVRQRAPPAVPAGPWRCEHCTFENRNPPIYDQLTQAYKGFCEICQGVTTVKGR